MTDLRTSLDELAEAAFADDPVCTVDIDKARADGRRRVLVSQLASVGGGLAVVAACALVANGLGGTVPAHPRPQSPTTTATAGLGFTGTDPLIPIGTFGYLPDGYRVNGYQITDYPNAGGGQYSYVGPNFISVAPPQSQTERVGQVPGPSNGLTLTKSAKEPDFSSKYVTVSPTTVTGSPKAYIVADHTDTPPDLSLAWQTASGSWFALGGDYAIHGTELTTLLTKIADSVNPEGAAVPMPIHVEGLPQGLTLDAASLFAPDPAKLNAPDAPVHDAMRAGLSYVAGGPGMNAYFSISVTLSAGLSPLPAKQTGTYVVRPSPDPQSSSASNIPQQGEGQGVCKDSKGLRICVLDHVVSGSDALASIGGPEALLDRITSLGTDKANWTTHVVN